MKKITQILTLFISMLFASCAVSQINNESEIYTILNIKIDNLVKKKNDTIFIRKETVNSQLKRILEEKKLIPKVSDSELIEIFTNENEIKYLTSQLKDIFLVDFEKINSKLVKEYIKPIEKKNEEGYYIQTKESLADFSKLKYTFSKPIFSKNSKYSFFIISRDKIAVTLKVYVQKNNQWIFLKNVGLSVS